VTGQTPTRLRAALWSGAFFVLVLGWTGSPAAAQEPDTTRTRPQQQAEQRPEQDTTTVDTVPPAPTPLPPMQPVGEPGWVTGVWDWDRDDLLRLPDLSLLHLLERIPGVVPVRADVGGQPEGAALFGASAGAIRYVVDGFVLDPLTSPTFDPSRLSLLALERVRVERGVTGATVRIETLTPDDGRTKSVIEAGTGDYGVNDFRGIFLPPRVFEGALGLGFERLSVNGFTPGPANHTVTWLKWTWARDSAGVQVEYRGRTLDRTGVGEGVLGNRSDWAVRARRAAGPVTAEAYVGATRLQEELGGEGGPALREGTAQGGVRVRARLPGPVPATVRSALRFRGHPRLPTQELDLAAEVTPRPWLALGGAVTHGWWSDADPTGHWSARAAVGPFLGLRAFGEVFRGAPVFGTGAGYALPRPDSGGVRVSRDGLRAGLQLALGGLSVGGAALRLSTDSVYGFGLPMEDRWTALDGGDAQGYELHVRIPTGFDPLSIQGWYVGMDAPGWLYTPEHHWRAGLVYHHLPLASGNLEIFARLEHLFRGRMDVFAPTDATTVTEVSDAYRATNLELTIRVVTVRAFLRWENLFHRLDQADLPAYELPGQHILWGVKWEFWN
jgi:hypothetical protein